jgi:hypothetical protein
MTPEKMPVLPVPVCWIFPESLETLTQRGHAMVGEKRLSNDDTGLVTLADCEAYAREYAAAQAAGAREDADDARLWRALVDACNAEPCKHPCLRDDLHDWLTAHYRAELRANVAARTPADGESDRG